MHVDIDPLKVDRHGFPPTITFYIRGPIEPIAAIAT